MSETNDLFRKQCVRKVSSPEGLKDYIHVIGPGVWITTIGLAVLIISAFVWGIFGSIPVTLNKPFIAQDTEVFSFFTQQQAAMLHTGMAASANGTDATVETIAKTPLSREEAVSLLPDDYTVEMMGLSDWNIKVTLAGSPSVKQGELVEVTIVPEAIRPIDYLVN